MSEEEQGGTTDFLCQTCVNYALSATEGPCKGCNVDLHDAKGYEKAASKAAKEESDEV